MISTMMTLVCHSTVSIMMTTLILLRLSRMTRVAVALHQMSPAGVRIHHPGTTTMTLTTTQAAAALHQTPPAGSSSKTLVARVVHSRVCQRITPLSAVTGALRAATVLRGLFPRPPAGYATLSRAVPSWQPRSTTSQESRETKTAELPCQSTEASVTILLKTMTIRLSTMTNIQATMTQTATTGASHLVGQATMIPATTKMMTSQKGSPRMTTQMTTPRVERRDETTCRERSKDFRYLLQPLSSSGRGVNIVMCVTYVSTSQFLVPSCAESDVGCC
mmetsp:Transcript_21973/g.39205  ORF Transcript_21973/g.39205 Transcript_21973/m.39205 type:complete len:276 (-) Transcript_21973:70-897(-)